MWCQVINGFMKCEVNLLRVFASVMFVEAGIKRKVVLFFYKGVMECVLQTCHSVTSQNFSNCSGKYLSIPIV